MILKEYQVEARDGLYENLLWLLKNKDGKRLKLVFQAPTGAGKTVTTAAFIQRWCTEATDYPTAFLWIAPNQLHLQSLIAFRSFFIPGEGVKPLSTEDLCMTDGLVAGDVLFLNWQSVSQEKNILIRDNEQQANLDTLFAHTIANNVNLIVILDEAHLFATKGDKANNFLSKVNAKVEIDVSATPILSNPDKKVEIVRKKVIEAEMIKQAIQLNPALDANKQEAFTLDIYLLQEALQKRDELKAAYQKAGSKVNPLLLIQLPNDTKSESVEDHRIVKQVRAYLESVDICIENARLAVWLSKEKQNLDGITDIDSPVRVLLFKQAIALGWDCPRAAVLLIYREIKQQTFTIQTVGRILRMPEQKHYTEPSLNYGYVYTNLSKDIITIVRDDMDYLVLNKARRVKEYEPLELDSYIMPPREWARIRLGAKFKKECLFPAAEEYFGVTQDFAVAGTTGISYYNAEKLKQKFVQLHVDKLEIKTIKDVQISGEEGVENITGDNVVAFEKQVGEIDKAFGQFCRKLTREFSEKESGPVLANSLVWFFEDYAQMNEWETKKAILYPNNEPHVIEWIKLALEKHAAKVAQQKEELILKKKNTNNPVSPQPWGIPEEKIFNENYIQREADKHVLVPFYIKKQSSQNEAQFIEFLKKNSEYIKWWYKNGEKNKEDFAISYYSVSKTSNDTPKQRTFFVDFIILLKNKQYALFDTKTLSSDPEAVAKHNALIDYVNEQNQKKYQGKKVFFGGIIVPDSPNLTHDKQPLWYFPKGKIEDVTNTSGWQLFDPRLGFEG